MHPNDYQKAALRTESKPNADMHDRVVQAQRQIFLALEEMIQIGKAIDGLKRFIFYNDQKHAPLSGSLTSPLVSFDTSTENRLLHAWCGIASEAGEIAERILEIATGQCTLGQAIPNLVEEGGDSQWYNALYSDAIGMTLGHIMMTNIEKLRKRYPEKFTEENAVNRDLENEQRTFRPGDEAIRSGQTAGVVQGKCIGEGASATVDYSRKDPRFVEDSQGDFIKPGDEGIVMRRNPETGEMEKVKVKCVETGVSAVVGLPEGKFKFTDQDIYTEVRPGDVVYIDKGGLMRDNEGRIIGIPTAEPGIYSPVDPRTFKDIPKQGDPYPGDDNELVSFDLLHWHPGINLLFYIKRTGQALRFWMADRSISMERMMELLDPLRAWTAEDCTLIAKATGVSVEGILEVCETYFKGPVLSEKQAKLNRADPFIDSQLRKETPEV